MPSWVVPGLCLLLGGAMACGESKRASNSDGKNGGSPTGGGSISGGSSNRGGSSGGGIGGASNGGANIGGEAGDSVTGGSGGSSAGEGGSGGESGGTGDGGSGSTCDNACSARDCCSEVIGLTCSNPSMAEVIVESAAPPVLPATMRLVGEAVRVTYCGSNPSDVTLSFDAGASDPRQLLVIRVDEDGRLMPLPVMADVDSVSANIDASGTYAAIELRPPDDCTPTTLTDIVFANSDASLAHLAGVTHLEGDLLLGGTVSNLDVLECLTSISGRIQVLEAASLAELELDGLVFVRDGIFVGGSSNLTRTSFARLFFVGTDDYGWSLIFENLESLIDVELPSLVNVPSSIRLKAIGQTANAPLELELGQLESIAGSLELVSVDKLANLDGVANLETVGGYVSLGSNLGLTQIDGFANLETVVGSVELFSNAALRSLSFPSLRALGEMYSTSLSCRDSPALTTLALPSVTELPGDIRLFNVGSEATGPLVVDFSSLETVATSIDLASTNLETMDGFPELRSVGGTLALHDLPALAEIDGLSNLEDASSIFISNTPLRTVDFPALRGLGNPSGDSLRLTHLPRLETVELGNVLEAQGAMTIFNTGDTAGASLTLNAGSLTTAGGLRLLNVWNLPEITGLGALRTLTSVIIIEDNPALSTLQGLATLQTAQSILSVQRNSLLPTCEAVELRDRLQSNGFDGAIVIRENLTDTCQ